ncbi:MAG: hypothetical protein IJV55_07210 [Paludibacteraceae bacterium]|nr:hypothetical protein [Paludibacteraceae bacterium]
MFDISETPKKKLVYWLRAANRKRKHLSESYARYQRWSREKYRALEQKYYQRCTEDRETIRNLQEKLSALKKREAHMKKWENNVNELVRRENATHNALFAIQECSHCGRRNSNDSVMRQRKATREFLQFYINYIDEIVAMSGIPDDVLLKLTKMRIALKNSMDNFK